MTTSDLEKTKSLLILSNYFDSKEQLLYFIELIKLLSSSYQQINELAKSDNNFQLFKMLDIFNYLNIFNSLQLYNLFVIACLENSTNIALLLIDKEIYTDSLKEFMKNYLSKIGNNFIIFKKIWEKNIIIFDQEDIEIIFFNILKSLNIEFIKWFYSMKQINLNDNRIKNKIGTEILEFAENKQDFIVIMCLLQFYIND